MKHRAASGGGNGPVSFVWSAAVGAAFATLYLALAPHVTGPKDAAEFTVVLALNGVPHPTGYPLYVLLGHPFVLLLHGFGASWAYAANAWSAIGGGVAMALLHALATGIVPAQARLGRRARFTLGLIPVAVFGVNPIWLLDAMFAEVYTWHLAWVCGAALFTYEVVRSLADRKGGRKRDPEADHLTRTAACWGVLCGLGFAHHATSAILIAVFSLGLLVALVKAGRWRPGLVLPAAAGAMVPLLAYGFIAWRAFHPAAYQWGSLEPSAASVLGFIRGSTYGGLLGRFAPDDVQRGLLAAHVYPLLVPALVLLAVSVPLARSGERMALATLAVAAGAQTLFAFQYGVRDPSSYFQPAMALACLALPAVGAWWLAGSQAPPSRPVVVGVAAIVLVGMVALGMRGLPLGQAIRLGAEETDRRMRATWDTIPPGPGFVLWDHDMASTFQVYQLLEGQRRELYAGNPAALTWSATRRAFRTRFGFDPLAGLEPLTVARAMRIPENVNRQTPLPVMLFDLDRLQVMTLPKP